jgi:hypothetical protein
MSEWIDVCVKCNKTRDNHVLGDECNFPIFLPMAVGGTIKGIGSRQLFLKSMEIGALAEEKRQLYGDSAAQYEAFLRLLWPNGVPLSSARDAGLMLRIFDKFMRIATSKKQDAENPWDDAAGYALIGAAGER